MNPRLHPVSTTIHGTTVVSFLMLEESDLQSAEHHAEWLAQYLQNRATKVGSVLEGILHEPHGESSWGWNE
jgi:hypothetical protein